MEIMFLVQHGKFAPGEIHVIDKTDAEELIKKGIARATN